MMEFGNDIPSEEPVEPVDAAPPIEETLDAATDAAVFYDARESIESLAECPFDDVEPALKRLGPPPFVRKGFPFLGLLATIYDHVAQRVDIESRSPFASKSSNDGEA